MLQVILMCHQRVSPSLGIAGAPAWGAGRSLLIPAGLVWPQLLGVNHSSTEAPLGLGRKEQLGLLGRSKALLSRCSDPGTEQSEGGKAGGEVRTSWLGREQLPPSPTGAPFIHQQGVSAEKRTVCSCIF